MKEGGRPGVVCMSYGNASHKPNRLGYIGKKYKGAHHQVAGNQSAHYQGGSPLLDARYQSAHYQGRTPQPDAAYQRLANTYRGRAHEHGTFREPNPQVYHIPRDLPEEGAEVEEVRGDGGPESLSGEQRKNNSGEPHEGQGDRKRDLKHDDKRSQV